MRILFALPLLTALAVAGCAHKQEAMFKPVSGTTHAKTSNSTIASAPAVTPDSAAPSSLIVTPGSGLAGKVARYNDAGRFVVLEFPVGHMPPLEQRLILYRGGLKVGEIKVTGPQRDDHIVADLTNGEAQAGDEVRDR
ncbi:MAG: hypothetical protein MUF81_05335 [Verrucomicrobia bacterium]|jgi:hypothetical protein|nr:hypothetical protein [Verrucomicrobiota bacterium]